MSKQVKRTPENETVLYTAGWRKGRATVVVHRAVVEPGGLWNPSLACHPSDWKTARWDEEKGARGYSEAMAELADPPLSVPAIEERCEKCFPPPADARAP